MAGEPSPNHGMAAQDPVGDTVTKIHDALETAVDEYFGRHCAPVARGTVNQNVPVLVSGDLLPA